MGSGITRGCVLEIIELMALYPFPLLRLTMVQILEWSSKMYQSMSQIKRESLMILVSKMRATSLVVPLPMENPRGLEQFPVKQGYG